MKVNTLDRVVILKMTKSTGLVGKEKEIKVQKIVEVVVREPKRQERLEEVMVKMIRLKDRLVEYHLTVKRSQEKSVESIVDQVIVHCQNQKRLNFKLRRSK